MNKQELIEEIKGLRYHNASKRLWVDRGLVLDLVEKLDEPNKPVVPQFVADWIERERKAGGDLEDLFDDIVCEQYQLEWFREEQNMNLVARAWLDGYEVEKEKRYRVRLKGIAERYCYLNYSFLSEGWFFDDEHTNTNTRAKHTRKELEIGGFGEVFDSPLFEVEEVEA